jgi:hypothetical protein
MNLQATIHNAIEDELIYCGSSADDKVEEIFERLRKALAPDMSHQQFDLAVADAKRDAQETLSSYVRIDLEMTSEAIADALATSETPEGEGMS